MSFRFPDVPMNIPGVPPVLRRIGAEAQAREVLARARQDNTTAIDAKAWGLFDQSGGRVLIADSVVSFEYGAEHRVIDYPIENGGFESYNKVALPGDVRLTLSKGGTLAERTAFLTGVELIRRSLSLYNVVTPERTYLDMNVERVSQVRNAQSGAGLAVVELILREIRQTATVTFTRTEREPEPAAAPPTPPPPMTPKTVRAPRAARKTNRGSVQTRKAPSFNDADRAAAKRIGIELVEE